MVSIISCFGNLNFIYWLRKKEFKSERVEVDEFKKVAVGEKLPGFAISLKNGGNLDLKDFTGDFIIILISNQVADEFGSQVIVDEEHGELAQPILDKEGHLTSICELKLAKTGFGIEIVYTSEEYYLKNSLLIIANSESRITKLYKNVKLGDVKEIINNIDKFIVEEK
ncbi:hypothetical protein [Halanaerobacter jeridensis]|uniref:Uncharacterized protein n=1 Tax=Halanaerobacter jeridensis TaxID=706427 RepID=A0A938XSQ5_9FIRM|nr:hypothetical protein [Halanaerobacter jeridensis]MBM7555611.1 hypothetical protein [Halanaerobacter jeridensis]